jgi:dihydrofolate reductase
MKAIIAVNNLGFIGKGDQLLWHNKKDLRHFKKLTEHSTLLVGYRTAKGLPPLRNRELIVVDRRDSSTQHYTDADWCIGGKKTYEDFCKTFTELHISHIDDNQIGDVTFPDLSKLNPDCKIFNYYF